MTNNGLSKHQRDKQRLKDVKAGYVPFPVPTRRQVADFRGKTPKQVYGDFPIRKYS